ncbi:protein prenylyltransferase [Hymenopellis radicata]|nr:protein prenylyltransferase [Hymenopellis radicata]
MLYADNPEWNDVVGVEQYEGVNPLAPIMYDEEYKDATNYFRAVVQAGEKSERVLALTETVIRMNPAHYSAWQYRYETLLALNKSLYDELRYMDPIAVRHLKNYQVWHHRQELAFLAQSLQTDTKNYHTWSYRQWLLAYFNPEDIWPTELDWVERLISDDVRNNSAWHHRFFLVFSRPAPSRPLRRELLYTKHQISLAPNNASAWNYLRGVLKHEEQPLSSVREFVELYAQERDAEKDIALADICEAEGGQERAKELWRLLADKYDTVRKRYWEWRIREVDS